MEVLRKMMNGTNGQGLDSYDKIGIANHIDYSSSNNHMGADSTDPIFRVLGAAWGLPKLFTATHKILQESDIHYSERCAFLDVKDDRLTNATDLRSCWQGQEGGGIGGAQAKRLELTKLFDFGKGV